MIHFTETKNLFSEKKSHIIKYYGTSNIMGCSLSVISDADIFHGAPGKPYPSTSDCIGAFL